MRISPIIVKMARALFQILTPIAATLESESQRLQGKGYYPRIRKEVNALLHDVDTDSKKPIIFFDVGANLGDYSLAFLKKIETAEIHCFEPSKWAFQTLKQRISGENVNHHNVALSDLTGSQPLYYDFEGSGWASLSKRDLSYRGTNFDLSEIVEVNTIDNWVFENGIVPDLLKIDVEGFELQVLTGAINTLRSVKVVQFEFGGTSIDSRHFFKDYWDFFKKLNFRLLILTPLGLKIISSYSEELECFKYSNYYAVNNELSGR
jgi:FkbM family methyltransferase